MNSAAAGLATARFVVLYHETPAESSRASHFDLMLETTAGPLRTWALEAWPEPPGEADAVLLSDHRPHYLEYEGAISNDRGWVRRIEHGTYEPLEKDDALEFRLNGESAALLLKLTPQGGNLWRAAFTAAPSRSGKE